MLDNLRDDSAGGFFEEDDSALLFPENEGLDGPEKASDAVALPGKNSGNKLLGMTAQQRFILAVMLMLAVCSLGAMCLLLTGRLAFY
ncbi:MAG: hypothetical protein Kow002_00940 [Anaerolineales bacterium]